jgi:hypothetical protein
MNFKTTLVLLVLVAIGAGLWYFAGRGAPAVQEEETERPSEREQRYVLAERPNANDIVRLEIERPDRPPLVFERAETKDESGQMEDWRMVEPLDSATENYVVNGPVTMLTGLQYERSFVPGAEDGVSLAEAGLEPPLATFKLTDKEGQTYTFEIGKQVALSNDTYVRLAGEDEVFVVGRDMKRDIEREVNDYRAKRLVKLAAADARHVRIDHDGTTYDFTRTAGDEWVINEPVKTYAQADKVKALVNALNAVRVKEFIDDSPESLTAYGLEPPFLTISVTTEKKELVVEEPESPEGAEEPTTQPIEPRFEVVTETHTLAVGDYADLSSETRYVKLPDQPWVASATTQQLDKLLPNLADIRDPSVTRVKASQVTRVELTTDGATATLEKKDGRWQGTGDLAELDVEAVNKLIEAFEDVTAIDYIDDPGDLAQYGLDHPRATLTVTTTGTVEPVSLHIGADTPSGRNTYVQVTGQTSVLVISAERAAELDVSPLALRSRVITSGTPEQIKRISVERGEKRYVLERKEDGMRWQMLEPQDAPVDPAAARELVNDLSRLRARQVVAKDDDASYGLTTPAVTIRFVMEQPAEGPPAGPESQPTTAATQPTMEQVQHTLLVGRRDNKTYARLDDVPYVFELDETVYKVMTQEFIRRGLFDIEGSDVAYLKIEAPGGTVEFQREEGQWVYPPDKFVRLSQKKVDDFVKELAELRVDAYLAYRSGDLVEYGLENAPVTVTMRLADESVITLKIDQVRRGELPRKAAWVEQQRVFLLRPAEAEKLMRGLDYYVKGPDTDEDSTPPRPPKTP